MQSRSNEENLSSMRKKTLLGYKYIDFKWSPYWVSFIGLSHDFDEKLEISSMYVFWINEL